MNDDDFFNDSDEIISLYSSKKIKETFRAQLHKIVSNSKNLNTNVKTTPEEKDSKNETEPEKKKSPVKRPKSPLQPVRSSTPTTPEDDSVEIISEFTPIRRTRQSERLRKKNGSLNGSFLSLDTPPRKQPNRNTKRRKKTSKKNGVPVDVIVLDDTTEPDNLEEDLNPEVSVKVIWKSVNVKKFQMRKFQKFSKIYETLSKEENIPEEKITLTFNNVKVNRNDTPDSLNLQVYHFLDGGVLSELTNNFESNSSTVDDSNKIMLKFQDVSKKIVKVTMDRKDKMKVGMIKCSEQLEIPLEKIKFYFDGELLVPSETPETLGLDNDEIIDVKITS